MISYISGSATTEVCDTCKTYIRDYTIPVSAGWSENATWEIVNNSDIYITDNIIKCNDC